MKGFVNERVRCGWFAPHTMVSIAFVDRVAHGQVDGVNSEDEPGVQGFAEEENIMGFEKDENEDAGAVPRKRRRTAELESTASSQRYDEALRKVRLDVERQLEENASFEDRLFKLLTGTGLVLSSVLQRSVAWHRSRQHRLTASQIAPALQISAHATRHNLWELLTGRVLADLQFKGNAFTAHGTAHEPLALAWYVSNCSGSDEEVRETGMWIDTEKPFIAASPDALVGDQGLLEIKCPLFKSHTSVPPDYLAQIQCQLHVTRREWCDFLSFTIDKGIALFRVNRSEKYWDWAYPQLEKFYVAVQADVELPKENPNYQARAAFAESLCDIKRIL